MKKITLFITAAALCYIAVQAQAVDIVQGNAGEQVTITVNTGLINGAQDVAFDPSAQVLMHGASETTAFSAISGHEAVQGKDAGQNYGMASDSSKVWWISSDPDNTNTLSISNTTTWTDTNSSSFTGVWNK